MNDITDRKLLIAFPSELLEEIEKYWHDKKVINRSEAIRQLIKKGLESEKARN